MTDRFSYKGNRRIICGLVLLISVFGAAMVFSASKGFGDNLELETSEHMFVETVSMVFGMAAAIACSYVTLVSTSYVSYTKQFFEAIKMPEILEKSSFFACIESKYVI